MSVSPLTYRYQQDAMTRLFQLLADVEECSTKLRVLSCITQLVNCMEDEVRRLLCSSSDLDRRCHLSRD